MKFKKLAKPDTELLKGIFSHPDFQGRKTLGENFHIQGVSIYNGQDDYKTSKILHVNKDMEVAESREEIKCPSRLRGIGGITIYLASEHCEVAAFNLVFHKGDVYLSKLRIEGLASPADLSDSAEGYPEKSSWEP